MPLVHKTPSIHPEAKIAFLTATLASTTLHALLRNLGDVGLGGLVGGLAGLLVTFLSLGLGDSGLTSSGADLGLSSSLSEDGSKVGTNDTTLERSQQTSLQMSSRPLSLSFHHPSSTLQANSQRSPCPLPHRVMSLCLRLLVIAQLKPKNKPTWTLTFFLDLFLATSSVIPFLCILKQSHPNQQTIFLL